MRLGRRTLVTLAATSLVGACADPFARPFADRRLFTLDVRREPRLPAPARGPVLAVRTFAASASAGEQGILTRAEPLTLRQDFYNQFFMPPSELVEDVTRQWLANTGLFRNVAPAGSGIDPTHVLDGELLAIYGDFTGERPIAVLHLALLLQSSRGGFRSIIHHGDYRREIPIEAANPEALVIGYNQALRDVLQSFERDISNRLR